MVNKATDGVVWNPAGGGWIGRILSSTPITYTVFYDNIDGKYRAENNQRIGDDYVSADLTDISTVIQSAITATAATGGGNIALRTLDAPLLSNVALDSKVQLIGEGIDRTILRLGVTGTEGAIYAIGKSNIGLKDLTIDVNGATYHQNGIQFSNCDHVHLKRVKVQENWYNGIGIVGGSGYYWLDECQVIDGIDDVTLPSTGITILNNATYTTFPKHTWITNCKVLNHCTNVSIGAGNGTNKDADLIIQGLVSNDSSHGYGLELGDEVTNIKVSDSDFGNNNSSGLQIMHGNVKVKHCNFYKNDVAQLGPGNLQLRGCDSAVIDGCTFIPVLAANYDLRVLGDIHNCDKVKIIHNDFQGAGIYLGTFTNLSIADNAPCKIEHHVASDDLTIAESGTVHTNLGAGANIKLTLPDNGFQGCEFEFAVMTAGQQLQIDPGAAGALYVNGAKQADDAYIWADDEGESCKVVCDGNHDWIVLYTQGTWTVV